MMVILMLSEMFILFCNILTLWNAFLLQIYSKHLKVFYFIYDQKSIITLLFINPKQISLLKLSENNMRQNRSFTSSKGQRNKNAGIMSLTSTLFNKIGDLNATQCETIKPRPSIKGTQKFILPRFDDLQTISLNRPSKQIKQPEPLTILQKAKQIVYDSLYKSKTNSKRSKIQKAKQLYRRNHVEPQSMFLTGCGIYHTQQPQIAHNQDCQQVDMNDALRYLVSHQHDDLEELRKMIRKTSANIQQYGWEVNRTKNKVVQAAGVFKKEMGTELRMRIGKSRQVETEFGEFHELGHINKRRLSTSTNQRPKNMY